MKNDALEAAREVLPLIRHLRAATEADRRIAEPIVERLRDARLCRVAFAQALGGWQLPPAQVLEVLELLAGAEASVSWIVWNNCLPGYFARFLEPGARDELFGDRRWLYASSTRPTGRASVAGGDYRVSGQWSLVSGCELADWIALMCGVEENGRACMLAPGVPEQRFMFVRRRDVEILDTWHTGGLRGTGSHDVVVRDVRVPQRWSVSPADPVQLEGTIGRLPIIANMAAGYAAQLLGIAAAALDTLTGLTATKVSPDPGPALGERPAVLAAIAQHDASLAATRAYLRARASELWDSVGSGPATLERITAVWTAAQLAMDAGRRCVEEMFAAAGTSALYTSCPLERAQRDLHAMSRHIVAQGRWLEDAGRVKLGRSPTHPLYAI